MLLTDEQIAELTRRRRPHAQLKMLRFMGIEHKLRADGSIAVLRSHVESIMGGEAKPAAKETEPDWSALDAPATQT